MSGSNNVIQVAAENNDIALRMFFQNPLSTSVFDVDALIEKKLTVKELYGENLDTEFSISGGAKVIVLYQENLLIIRTEGEVIILLSGNTPAIAIHIETRGSFGLVDGPTLNLKMGMYVKADGIILDLPVASDDFITLVSADKEDSMLHINFPISTDKLNVQTSVYSQGSIVRANTASISYRIFERSMDSELYIGDGSYGAKRELDTANLNSIVVEEDAKQAREIKLDALFKRYYEIQQINEAKEEMGGDQMFSPSCRVWRTNITKNIYRRRRSRIIGDSLKFVGISQIADTDFHLSQKIHFAPESKVELVDVKVYTSTSQIDKKAEIKGRDVFFELKQDFDVDGKCIIDDLVVSALNSAVCGVVWGKKRLHMQIRENSSFNGIVGSEKTKVKSKYLLVSAILGNEALYHEGFISGGLVGTSELDVDALIYVRTGGGYMYSPTIFAKGGINVGLMSYVRNYNYTKNFLYNYDSLEIIAPCKPEHMSDLIDRNKMLRVAEMIGGNFPLLRGVVATLNVGAYAKSMFGPTLSSAVKSIYHDPNPFHQLEYLVKAGRSTVKSKVSSVHESVENIVHFAMREWNTDNLKELVDILLHANNLRIQGNALISQTTNAVIFVNDIQNCILYNPDITFDNVFKTAVNSIKSVHGRATDSPRRERFARPRNTIVNLEFINENLLSIKKTTSFKNTNESAEERISFVQAAKEVVTSEVSRIVNAPITIINDIVAASQAIKSISPTDTVTSMFTSNAKQVDSLITACSAVWNEESSPVPIQYPTLDGAFAWDAIKETAKLLGPSIISTSFVSDEGGITLTGNYIVNTGFYRNRGVLLGYGSAVHCAFDSSNSGVIYSHNHTESVRNRNNRGILSTSELNIKASNNNEYGTTEATTRLIFDVKSQYIAEGAKFISTGQTFGTVSGKFLSYGANDFQNGFLNVGGDVIYSSGSRASAKNLKMNYGGDVTRSGEENFDNSSLNIAGHNRTTFTGEFNHNNVSEHIAGNSNDAARLNKTSGSRTVDGQATYEKQSKLNAIDVDFRYNNGLKREGEETAANGSIFIDGAEDISKDATTKLYNVKQETSGDFRTDGNLSIENSRKHVGGKSTFGEESKTHASNLFLSSKVIHRADSSKFTFENILKLEGDHIGSDLGSTLIGAEDSLLYTKSQTLSDLGAHNAGYGIYDIAELAPDHAHELTYGLGDQQNKTYAKSVLVSTDRTETLAYTPSARADGALATLLTKGGVTLPYEYIRAIGVTFASYAEAERFIAEYDSWGLPEISKFKKSLSQNFYEEATKGCAAGVSLGIISGIAGSSTGFIVAAVSYPLGLFTGHNARVAARKEQARINDQAILHANIWRDIDQRLVSHDEKADLAELYNSYNSSRIDELYQNLGIYNNSSMTTHSLTTEGMLQYQENIRAIYSDKRLYLNRDYEDKINKISKYISDRAQQIRESWGFNISAGSSANFGATGYTVSGTYGAGFGGTIINGSVPIYDKTYTHSWPSQQQTNTPSRDLEYQIPDIPPVVQEDLIFTTSDTQMQGRSYLGMPEIRNSMHNATAQLNSMDYLTSPGFQYNSPRLIYDSAIELRSTDSSTMLFSQPRSRTSGMLEDRGYLTSPGFRAEFQVHDRNPSNGSFFDRSSEIRNSRMINEVISYREKVNISDRFIAHLECELMQVFTADEKSLIRQQLKLTKYNAEDLNDDPKFTISVRGGVIDLGSRKIYTTLPNHMNSMTSMFQNSNFSIATAESGGNIVESYSGARSLMNDVHPISKVWSLLKGVGRVGFGTVGQVLTLAISPGNIARDNIEDQPFRYSELDFVDVYNMPGSGAPIPQLPTRFINPAWAPGESHTGPLQTPIQTQSRDGNIVSEYGSVPARIDLGPLVTPIFQGMWHNELYKDNINRPNAPDRDKRYYTPPDTIPFEGAKLAKPKGNRKRWRLSDGRIAEWDRQHGEIEMYDKKGNHIGVFSPIDGCEIKPRVSGRKIEI
jgi:hypothetical protein